MPAFSFCRKDGHTYSYWFLLKKKNSSLLVHRLHPSMTQLLGMCLLCSFQVTLVLNLHHLVVVSILFLCSYTKCKLTISSPKTLYASCVSCPLSLLCSDTVYSLTISGSKTRMSPERLSKFYLVHGPSNYMIEECFKIQEWQQEQVTTASPPNFQRRQTQCGID